ncbi:MULTISPECIES: hypothetical protein [unclassified Methanoregula]|uniref:hypothetical protein n=1 Tax=unclassified Methanoregula TaxID=2649730 RepID=UPI0009C6BC43|nr:MULTISPECIES: hypothetical protein [unclassified Methanoregula]OPX61950.1 MAG: hypothetical protein A4E33_02547 [Methanoregula sp. PtaB.Bin085]OPY34375.1 MAG: hypothetical protein A4E34_01420 [Methanoregula sp. PtaU1.Bin006]
MTVEREQGDCGVRLGIDIGVSAVVIAACGPGGECRTLAFPGISREVPAPQGSLPVHLVPALIEYRDGGVERRGDAVLMAGTADSPGTARWLRQYLCDNSPVQVPAGNGRMVRYDEAAADLLAPLLSDVFRQYPGAHPVFSLPDGAPPGYAELLQRIARNAGACSCSTICEYEAVLEGYGYLPADGEHVLLVSFTETGLEIVALARAGHSSSGGDRSGLRVLARANGPVSCREIDAWIVHDLLARFRLPESDPRALRLMPQLWYEASLLRERLPASGDKVIRMIDTLSGRTFEARFGAADFDRILAAREVVPLVEECIGRVLSSLRTHGVSAGLPGTVFLVGSGCAIPAIQEAVRSRCWGAAVYDGHLLDAAARGAAGYRTPLRTADRIACSYALRYWDPAAQEHHYRFLVHSGTRYPSAGQVARVIISAAYDGQTHLGIPLYEIGGTPGDTAPRIELVSDSGGGVRLAGPAQDADRAGQAVHANQRSPTLLVATPPARKGEPRFECTFTIDPERNLCLSARDLLTGALVKLNAPVHRLT